MSRAASYAVLGALLLTATAEAADKALLIGVGNYRIPSAALPGIDKDLERMQDVARLMGFEAANTKTLVDSNATLLEIRLAIQQHLVLGSNADDRVLFYFSGHGTQVRDESGDEADAVDEALMPYDTTQRYSRGEVVLENLLLDDEFERLLEQIPAGEIIVIVDACHSGTVTRVGNPLETSVYFPKTFFYEGMPTAETFTRGITLGDETNYTGVSAAMDGQLALATENGSVFTAAVYETILEQEAQSSNLNVTELSERVTTRIHAVVDEARRFDPQIAGSYSVAEKVSLLPVDKADTGDHQ